MCIKIQKDRRTLCAARGSRQDARWLEWAIDATKLSPAGAGREMKRVAVTSEPPVVVPVIVVAIDVHITLVVVPPVERDRIV